MQPTRTKRIRDYKGYSLIGGVLTIPAILVTVVALTALSSPQGSEPSNELVIIAKNMAFTVVGPQGADQVNPQLRFSAGASITIIFRNEDPGMRHDLVLEGLAVRSRILSFGQQQRITFTVPEAPGEYPYLCSIHPQMMRGQLAIYPARDSL